MAENYGMLVNWQRKMVEMAVMQGFLYFFDPGS